VVEDIGRNLTTIIPGNSIESCPINQRYPPRFLRINATSKLTRRVIRLVRIEEMDPQKNWPVRIGAIQPPEGAVDDSVRSKLQFGLRCLKGVKT
jgi:hypothetical protein